MTIKEKVKLVLRKHQDTRFSRGRFMWGWLEEYYGAETGITKSTFLEFWKEEASIERSLREILKTPEFKLPPEQDSLRYEKSFNFQQKYAKRGL